MIIKVRRGAVCSFILLSACFICLNGLWFFDLLYASDNLAFRNYLSFKTADEKNNIEIFKKASRPVVYVTNKEYLRDFFHLMFMKYPQAYLLIYITTADSPDRVCLCV